MGVLHALSTATGALVVAIDHYGKDTSGGSRGAFAKEDRADTILALLGDRAPHGAVTNGRVCLRKVRGEQNGLVFPFELRRINLGKDENGDPSTSCVVDWVEGVAREKSSKAKGPPRGTRLLVEADGDGNGPEPATAVCSVSASMTGFSIRPRIE
jgi:hypothetical protein